MRFSICHAKGGVGATIFAVLLAKELRLLMDGGVTLLHGVDDYRSLCWAMGVSAPDDGSTMPVSGNLFVSAEPIEPDHDHLVIDSKLGHVDDLGFQDVFSVLVCTSDYLSLAPTVHWLVNNPRPDHLVIGMRGHSALTAEDVAGTLGFASWTMLPWTAETQRASDAGLLVNANRRDNTLAVENVIRAARRKEGEGDG